MKKIIYFIIIIILESCLVKPDIITYDKIYFKNETLQNLNLNFFTSKDKKFSITLQSNSMDSLQIKYVIEVGDPPHFLSFLQYKDNVDFEIGESHFGAGGVIDSLEIEFNSDKNIGFNINPDTKVNFNLLEGVLKTDSFFYIKYPPNNIDSFTRNNNSFGSYFGRCNCPPQILIILRPSLYDSAK